MKKIIAIILIAIQLLLCSYTPPNFTIVYKNYESAEPVHDYAEILDDDYIGNHLGKYYFHNDSESVELSVYTYVKEEDSRYLLGELKERGVKFIALLIQVDADRNYVDYRVEYNTNGISALPDKDELHSSYLKARTYLELGNYDYAILTFFQSIKGYIDDSDWVYQEKTEDVTEQYRAKEQEGRKKAGNAVIIIPILISFIVALCVANAYTKKLKKQLDTITDNVENIYYMNDNKTRFSHDHLPNQSNYWEHI